ncbi:MAG: site-2 protease family protein [bacterium]|nr:site-2 protease family protein [bacterium]
MTQVSELAISIPVLLFSVIIHECAHGWTAEKFGDPTARAMGRLTLNPLPHIDPFGTVLLPILLAMAKSPIMIGWAKPVPVNFQNLRNPKKDILWVGISGPVVNILMAIVSGLLSKILILATINNANIFSVLLPIRFMLKTSIDINIILAVFNMTPIPPLDGSRFVYSLLPDKLAYYYGSMEKYGFFVLLLLMYTGILNFFIVPLYSAVIFIFHFLRIL